MRRELKAPRRFVDPAKQEAFRDQVKAVELEAERLQQEALYAFTQSGPLGKPSEPPAAARGNVAAYERVMGASFPKASVDVLVRAFDGLTGALTAYWNRARRPWHNGAIRNEGGMAKTAARLIVGISGASGTIYGVRLLEMLRKTDIETHLVMSKSAEMTLVYETDLKPKDVRALASVHYPVADIGAAISSGSFPTMGMIIAPCSIRTMSEIATGVTATLLSRAADVVLKEKRRLVLAVRETPLHGGHLRTMTTLADIGAVIAPIVPAFYNRPKSVDDIINHTCGRLLDLFGIDTGMVKRWKGGPAEA